MRWLLACFVLMVFSSFAEAKQNLLIITVDDMSADSIGLYGCPIETTPHIDKLGHSSLRFEHAHVQVGNCMPSRNVMWSGRYPHNNGVEGFYQVKDASYPVLCDVMKSAGYFTGIRGKVTHSTPYSPYAWDQVLDTDDKGKLYALKDPASYGASTRDGISAAEEAGKPFCLLINISDPHKPFYSVGKGGKNFEDPFVPSRVFTADEVPIPDFLFDDPAVREELALYYSSVRRADDCVGAILHELEAAGKTDETVIMFLSDHGMPLPFAKTQLYFHSTHTPLMIRWPGVTEPDHIDTDHMVSAVDFLPTLLDIFEIKKPEGLDGRSFAPVLAGKTQKNRNYVVKEYNENAGASRDPMRAVESKKYLYLFNPWSNGERVMATATTGTATYRRMAALAKTNSYLKERLDLYQHRVLEELYDVESDPACLHNLVDVPEFQGELNNMRSRLEDWLVDTKDPMLAIYQIRNDDEAREAAIKMLEEEALERRKPKNKNRQGKGQAKGKRNEKK